MTNFLDKIKIQFSTMQLILGCLIVTFFFILVGMLFFIKIPTENIQIVNILIGAIGVSFTTIIAYYFGSSKGSADKNELLKNKE